MSKYYDEKCQQCEQCYYFAHDSFPDGRPYEACRAAGYILHLSMGISTEPCKLFRTEEQYKEEKRQRELAKKKRK